MNIKLNLEAKFEIGKEVGYVTRLGVINKGIIKSIHVGYNIYPDKEELYFSYGIDENTISIKESDIYKLDTKLIDIL